MSERIEEPLPEALMKAIRATVQASDMTAQEKLHAVVLITNGYGLFASQTSINPTKFAIPEEQWGAIMGLLQTVPSGSVAQVNMALEWMNIGPSSYKPEGATNG